MKKFTVQFPKKKYIYIKIKIKNKLCMDALIPFAGAFLVALKGIKRFDLKN